MHDPILLPYARYSNPSQAAGASRARQTDRAMHEEIAAKLGLRLETGLVDAGLSGLTGANRMRGALKSILSRIETGEIPAGSSICIESLDRLSREDIMDALSQFLAIVNDGKVGIYTVKDGKHYTPASLKGMEGAMNLILSLVEMARAHEESALKGSRVRDARQRKREAVRQAAEGGGRVVATANVAGWLDTVSDPDTGQRKHVLNGRAKAVRMIFRDAAKWGVTKIAQDLNRLWLAGDADYAPMSVGKRETNAKGWSPGQVARLLHNRICLGEWQPTTRNYVTGGKPVPVGEPIPNHYPAAITQEEWDAAHAMLARRRDESGVGTGNGRSTTVAPNLFAKIASCAACGSSLTIRQAGTEKAGRKPPKYLVCDSYRRGRGCTSNTYFDYALYEAAMLEALQGALFDPERMSKTANPRAAEIADERDTISKRIDFLKRRITAIMGDESLDDAMLADALQPLRDEAKAKTDRMKRLDRELSAVRGDAPVEDHIATIRKICEAAKLNDPEARGRIHASLQSLLEAALFDGNARAATLVLRYNLGSVFISATGDHRTIVAPPVLQDVARKLVARHKPTAAKDFEDTAKALQRAKA